MRYLSICVFCAQFMLVLLSTSSNTTQQCDGQLFTKLDKIQSSINNIWKMKPKAVGRLLQESVPVTPSTVAFFAQMSSKIPASEATSKHVLVFDVVKTNAGNGYHPSTGVFIVPESGIYVFSWSFRNGNNHYHSTELVVNNSIESVIHLHTGAGNWLSGTGVAVLHVNKGDDVYVRISSLSHYGDIHSDNHGRSSFSGWKLN